MRTYIIIGALLFVSCRTKSHDLGADFELMKVTPESPREIVYVMPYGEVILVEGPILEVGVNSQYLVAKNMHGYYYLEKDEVRHANPPKSAVKGPITQSELSKIAAEINLPNLQQLNN